MKAHWVLLLATGLVLGADDAGKDAKDQDRIQGSWKVVGLQLEGQEILGDTVKELRLAIKGEMIQPEGDFPENDRYGKFTFKLDPTTKPRIFDATIAAGNDKGTVLEGIYQLEGDKLKLCVRLIGKDRPSDFASKVGSGVVLVTLERIK